MKFSPVIALSLGLSFFGLLSCSLARSEPLAGKWERRFTAFMFDYNTKTYNPWEEPLQTKCLSLSDLRGLTFLTPAASKITYGKNGEACVVSDERRVDSTVSWRMVCKEPDGNTNDMRMATTVSDNEIVNVINTIRRGDEFGPDGMKTEIRLRRIGDCERAVDKR